MKLVLLEYKYTAEEDWYAEALGVCPDDVVDRAVEVFTVYGERSDPDNTRVSCHDWHHAHGPGLVLRRTDPDEDWLAALQNKRYVVEPQAKDGIRHGLNRSPYLIPDNMLEHLYHYIVEVDKDGDEVKGIALFPHLPLRPREPDDEEIYVSGDDLEGVIANAFEILRQKR